MSTLIETEFGKANINNKGYYHIVSTKEGNFSKKLHRLIYEKHHKCCLLSNADIHHIDGDKLNNSIENLGLLSHAEHSKSHMIGENNPMYGKRGKLCPSYGLKRSDETKQKISDSNKGRKVSFETKYKLSKKNTSTGLYNVIKRKNKQYKQGFSWMYQYREGGKIKTISSTSLRKLEEKVKSKNLPWLVLDEEKAKQTLMGELCV